MNQLHLAEGLETLSQDQQEVFLKQLQPELLDLQQKTLRQDRCPSPLPPVVDLDAASKQWEPLGSDKISQGKVACLILAGGQGSRLGSHLPKALFPIADGKTLLEIQLDKIARTPCAIITSPGSHQQIADFLKSTPFAPTLVCQPEAPFLDSQGNWILRCPGQLASGPDGNGHALHLLKTHGILEEWKRQGIEIISIIPIDNPLADPIDPVFIGYHTSQSADTTLKVIRRQSFEEKVGILVHNQGRILVQEYSELAEEQEGSLAYTVMHALTLSFAERVSNLDMPWHIARKQDPISKQWIWKFERFLFDTLVASEKTHLLLYPREEIFAPLKDEKSLATVQQALQNRACTIYK